MSLDYVARCGKCNALNFWCSESRAADESKEIAKAIKSGQQVERMETAQAQTVDWCKCWQKTKTPSLFAATSSARF